MDNQEWKIVHLDSLIRLRKTIAEFDICDPRAGGVEIRLKILEDRNGNFESRINARRKSLDSEWPLFQGATESEALQAGLTHIDNILLLGEIADTTLETDRKRKAPAYAKAGIPDYWILDVNTRQVYVFREPCDGNYQLETVFNEDDVLSMLAFPEIEVQISQLFP